MTPNSCNCLLDIIIASLALLVLGLIHFAYKKPDKCLPCLSIELIVCLAAGWIFFAYKSFDNCLPGIMLGVIAYFVIRSIIFAVIIRRSCKKENEKLPPHCCFVSKTNYAYPKNGVKHLRCFIIFAFVGLIVTTLLCGIGLGLKYEMSRSLWKMVWISLWLAWLIVPPAWFLFDYFEIYLLYGDIGKIDRFKYGQQVAGVLWLTGVTMTSATLYMLFKIETGN